MEIPKKERIRFIGIGGASMSALALLALRRGAEVGGSDKNPSEILDRLKEQGIEIDTPANPDEDSGADLVVYSSAVKEDDSELSQARKLGIRTLDRAEYLGEVAKNFGYTIAIGGTHGKTTVTAMLAVVLKRLGVDFVGHVGGETEYGNPVYGGAFENADFAKFVEKEKDGIFLTEACEYKKNLLRLTPDVGVVLNAECDHPDCYPDLKSVEDVFGKFLDKCRVCILPLSQIGLCSYARMRKYEYDDIENEKCVARVFSDGRMDLFTYENTGDKNGKIRLKKNGEIVAEITLPDTLPSTPKNVAFVFAVTDLIGLPNEAVGEEIENFSGVKRRHEYAGKWNGARVIFDYAHHPSQIENVLSAHPDALVVFQPHTYSRTAKYFDDFVRVLSRAKALVLMLTYGAREGSNKEWDSSRLRDGILSKNAKSEVYLALSHNSTLEIVKTLSFAYDEILMLGAGDIYDLKGRIPYDEE